MADKNEGVLATLFSVEDRLETLGEDPNGDFLIALYAVTHAVSELLTADTEYHLAVNACMNSKSPDRIALLGLAMKRRAAAIRAMRGEPPVG